MANLLLPDLRRALAPFAAIDNRIDVGVPRRALCMDAIISGITGWSDACIIAGRDVFKHKEPPGSGGG
jgi:hypothetical protein